MIEIKTKISDIKNSNLVYLIEKKSDLKKLDFLQLDKKIVENIEENVKKGEKDSESIKVSFFIGEKHFENLFIFYYNKKSKKTLIEFLGEEFPKLPKKLSILSNIDSNILSMIDSCLLSRYNFDKYKTKKEEKETNIIIDKKDKKIIEERLKTINNIILARDLAETPSNDLKPKDFADLIKKTKFKNIKVKILTPKDIEKKGLGLINAVGKGSANKPYIVILEKIVDKKKPTYGLVGKGITFDSGGIQVKPGDSMYEMKGDMSGAAITFATMKELDEKTLNINLVACICLAENAISGEGYKPSDIIKAYNGKTVDIVHTDAEGRLILADGISYISKNYNLDNIMSIATLTGAVMVALGFRYAGIMGNDRKTIKNFIDYSKNNFEKYVELPFDNYFIEKTKSEIADVKNLTSGIYAGSSMGAAFLSNFVDNNELYTHIDIAGTAINSYEAYGLFNKGMTGFGVDSISEILLNIK